MLPEIAPDPYILILTGLGLLIALVAWLPLALKRLPLSLPIICIAIGAGVFLLPQITLRPLPVLYPDITERFTEFVVIIALMGAGLKIDRLFGWRRWAITWRLLLITMPLGILAITLLGQTLLGLPFAIALLLAASLAPTDPVLAADIQVGPPRTGDEDDVRFGLTSEAGLNDGAAFPFVHLARTGDGLIALSATLVSYGLTEIVHVYGFLAVFVTALTFRSTHRDHDFQLEMHAMTEQVERLAMMVLLILFGGALVSGLLARVGWIEIAAALLILLVIRPLTGWIAMLGHKADHGEKWTLAFFGIRGVGSIYYLAYGINHMAVPGAERLWAIVGLVVLMSVLLHGLTVTPIMRLLDHQRGIDPDAQGHAPPGLQGPAGEPDRVENA